ncbi:hypothetical protein [Thauera sp.]|uniref:restriction endonuclease subunit S n=1 Tax=Thauera sp. TaxID=1905334 RepID=UPI002B702DE4|nr:hypothetical protein [Thauera sp.]HRP24328.1 hypothetical protein [Thauera sp.]
MSFPRYPEYKDSGVEWMGEVPGHWELLRVRQVATLNPSKSEVAALPPETELSFLPMEAIGEDGRLDLQRTRPILEVSSGYTYFRDGDVTIAKITPCFENGKGAVMCGLVGGAGFGTTELIVARPKPDETTSEYLHWVFVSQPFRKLGEASMYGAGGQKRVPDDFVRDFRLAFPPLREQCAISAFLDRETAKIDALVAEQQNLIALLKEKRQALISHAVTKGLDPGVPLKDSGVAWLGEVPAHWRVCALRRAIAKIEQGWSPDCHARPAEAGEWGVLKAGCVNGGKYRPAENKALPSELLPDESYCVKVGDVLMSRASGSPDLVGSTALVRETPGRLMLSDKIFRLRLENDVDPAFFVAMLSARALRAQIEQALSGGNGLANNLPQSNLLAFICALPPEEEQIAIAARLNREVDRLDQLMIEAESTINLLMERRTALISAAVTGKIDVRHFAAASAEPTPEPA